MEKEFVPYEQALALKELGFDENCFGYYIGGDWDHDEYDMTLQFEIDLSKGNYLLDDKKCTAPTYSQAFRWFRDTHNMLANVYSNASGFLLEYHDTIGGTHRYDSEFSGPNDGGCWDTYEEAELACLVKLIEIVKEKN